MDKLYTTNEVAQMYGVATKTVLYWKQLGAPTAGERQLRGRYPTVLFDKKELQKWLDDKHRRTPVRKL